MILNMTLQNYLNETLRQKEDRVNSLRLKLGKARPLTTLSKGLLLDVASKQARPLFLMVPMPGLWGARSYLTLVSCLIIPNASPQIRSHRIQTGQLWIHRKRSRGPPALTSQQVAVKSLVLNQLVYYNLWPDENKMFWGQGFCFSDLDKDATWASVPVSIIWEF